MSSFFKNSEILQSLPTTRAAYSDRTAWMMSEMSALAYLPFEGENHFRGLFVASSIAKIARTRKDSADIAKHLGALRGELKRYIDHKLDDDNTDASPESEPTGLTNLRSALKKIDFEFVCAFNESDTQAFLAKRSSDSIAVLAFRGTEANKWKDVKTDLDARFYKGTGGVKIHSGFRGAYECVREQVQEEVRKLEGFSLYVTGHSLGGALATIAARDLERDSLAACYTFGGPRVGDEEFIDDIHAPVYRIVNAADGVPRVPPSWLTYILVFIISFFHKGLADAIEKRFCGYKHVGDMRYLTACDSDLSKLKVIPNLSMPFRVFRLGKRIAAKGFLIAGKDHSIAEYQRKLRHYAEHRKKD